MRFVGPARRSRVGPCHCSCLNNRCSCNSTLRSTENEDMKLHYWLTREGFGVEGRSWTRKRLRMGLLRQAFCSWALREFMLSSCWHHDWDRFTWTKREDRTARHQQRGAERCRFSPLHVAQMHTEDDMGLYYGGCQCCQHAALTVQDLLCSSKYKRTFFSAGFYFHLWAPCRKHF